MFKEYVVPLIPALVLFALGYLFVDRVNLDTESRKVQASTAEKIETYFSQLYTGEGAAGQKLDPDEARAKAIALGAFGEPALMPLILAINQGGDVQSVAGVAGLRHAGFLEPDATCDAIESVLLSPGGAYAWRTHEQLVKLLPLLRCQNPTRLVAGFEARFEQHGNDWFADDMTDIQLQAFKVTLDDAQRHLAAAGSAW